MPHQSHGVYNLYLLTLIQLLLVLLLVTPARGNEPTPPIEGPPSTKSRLAAIEARDALAAPGNARLDSALAAVAASARTSLAAAHTRAAAAELRTQGDRILVQARFRAAGRDRVIAAIARAGGMVTRVSAIDARLQGWLPINALETLANDDDIVFVYRPAVGYAVGELQAIQTTTEGLALMNAPAWHQAGYTGAGTKIAVIDLGFQGYTSLLGGELPANLIAKNFVDGESDAQVGSGADPHGTGCAEIVYDVAPGAQMYLVKIQTELDLEQAVNWLMSQHVNVISMSVVWYGAAPGDGTGFFADLVSRARAAGIVWIISSGNERQRHWDGAFSDPDSSGFHDFSEGKEVNYIVDRGGALLLLGSGVRLRAYLTWDDWTRVNQDYTLYIERWNGQAWQAFAWSNNPQTGAIGQTPTEGVSAVTTGGATYYGFAIYRNSGSRAVNLNLVIPDLDSLYYHLNWYVPARSVDNLADAPAAVTVAAVNSFAPFAQPDYSSEGPTYGPGGTLQGGLFKPDLAAYTFVSTLTFGTGNSRFIGTSASAPHVAGAAALVLDRYPQSTPASIKAFLLQRAIDVGTPGPDTRFGYGRLYLGAPRGATRYLPLLRR